MPWLWNWNRPTGADSLAMMSAKWGRVPRTDEFQARFGEERVFDTPISESGIVGTAAGMAVYGLRPVVEIQFAGFAFLAFNQIVSQVTHLRTRSGGVFTVPLVIRAPFGGGVRTPEHHSESVEGFFMHIPGIKIVIPSNPYDARVRFTRHRRPDPVLFLEHMKLYRSFRQELPAERIHPPWQSSGGAKGSM